MTLANHLANHQQNPTIDAFLHQHIVQLSATFQYATRQYPNDPILDHISYHYLMPDLISRAIRLCYSSSGPMEQDRNAQYAFGVYDSILEQAVCGKIDVLLNRRLMNSRVENQLSLQKAILSFYDCSEEFYRYYSPLLSVNGSSHFLISLSPVPLLSYNEILDVLHIPLKYIYSPENTFLVVAHEVAHVIIFKGSLLRRPPISEFIRNAARDLWCGPGQHLFSSYEDLAVFIENIFSELLADELVRHLCRQCGLAGVILLYDLLLYDKAKVEYEGRLSRSRAQTPSRWLLYYRCTECSDHEAQELSAKIYDQESAIYGDPNISLLIDLRDTIKTEIGKIICRPADAPVMPSDSIIHLLQQCSGIAERAKDLKVELQGSQKRELEDQVFWMRMKLYGVDFSCK